MARGPVSPGENSFARSTSVAKAKVGIPDLPWQVGLGTKPKTLPPTQDKPTVPAPGGVNPYASLGLDPRVAPYITPSLAVIDTQQKTQQQALQQFTEAVLAQLQKQPAAISSDYNQAIDQSQALAQAGSDSLKNANGNASIQELLKAAGAPQSQQDQVAAQLGNVFNGGASALFGNHGVFPGQQLIRDKASASAFANELPGINALAGTSALKNLLYQSGLDRQKVLATVPSIMGDIAKQDATTKQAAADAAYKNRYLSVVEQANGVKAKSADANISQGNTRLGIAQQNADTAASRATEAAAAAQQRIAILQQNANTAAKKAAATKAGAKAPTGGQLNTLVDQWYGGKNSNVRKAVVDDKGKQKTNLATGAPLYVTTTVKGGQLSYQQAVSRLTALNVPQEQATALLDTKFQRGERGRPWLGYQERTVLAKAGVKPTALYFKKHAFLNAAQASVLNAANALPPGELVNGRYFIQPGY